MTRSQPVEYAHTHRLRRASGPLAVVTSLLFAVCFGQPVVSGAEAADGPGDGAAPSPSDQLNSPTQAAPEVTDASCQSKCKPCRRFKRVREKSRCGRCCRRVRRCGNVPAKPDPYTWEDIFDGKTLEGWKVPEFGGEGEVRVEDGTIVMEMGASMTGITYTGEVLRTDFEIELEGMRLDGSDFFCTTTFPVGKEPCTLVVGGWGGTVVGLSTVDYYDASDNLTTTFLDLKDKQWYKVRIRVTEANIVAWIDDEQVVKQPRKGHHFGIRSEVDLCQPLGVSCWDSKAALRNIRIRRVKPEPPEPDEPGEN